MRNRWGVEIKRGYFAWARTGRNGEREESGRVVKLDSRSDFARAYGAQITLQNDAGREFTVNSDAITQVLPPMRRTRGGVVKANPIAEARELFLYAINDAKTYRLVKEIAAGGAMTWNAIANQAARNYAADHANLRDWNKIFSVSDREVVASMLREHYAETGVVKMKRNPLSRVAIDSPSQRERTTATGKRTKRPSARLIERRVKTASTSRKGIYANPLTRVKVNSPSMATDEAPDARLLDRRKRTAKAPAGFYANPLKPSRERYHVSVMKPRDKSFQSVARFKLWEFAAAYGRALRNAHPTWTVKIEERT